MSRKSVIIVSLVIVLIVVLPLIINADAEYGGADGIAMEAVEDNPDFEPIMEPLVSLESGEVESMLFALQASLGAGFIGYFLAYMRYRSKSKTRGDAA